MACPDPNELADLARGTLPPLRRRAVESHLQHCPACAKRAGAAMGRTASAQAAFIDGVAGAETTAADPYGQLPFEETSFAPETAPRSGEPPAPGQQFGRYVVEGYLGSGAMGFVCRARDPMLERRVALKVLHPATRVSAERAQEANARLLREAQAMATLSHPNVVPVHDAGEVDGQVFLAMEYVEGQTLEQWLAVGGRHWRDVVVTFCEAGRGIAAAHAAGILHRDFKPANVLIGQEGRVRVTDFGLARQQWSESTASGAAAPSTSGYPPPATTGAGRPITKPGVILGTPAYMAPEQLFAGPVDARVDQFSFCVALYEALYGHHPFNATSLEELRRELAAGRCRPPQEHRGVPSGIADALLRGLRCQPEERFASMGELLAALERAAVRRGSAHIRLHFIAQVVFSLIHLALSLLLLVLTITGGAADSSGGSTASTASSATAPAAESVGAIIFGLAFGIWLLICVCWCALGSLWAPINAYGLHRRKAWARLSTLAYAVTSMFTCIGVPYGIYGLWSLRQPDVRDGLSE